MILVCPEHDGAFDCNPFCYICEGEQEFSLNDFMQNARGIAFDTCHKIYVLMDDEQVEKMRGYGYDPLITSDELDSDQMADKVMEWYNESCGLRFIQAVRTDVNDPNAGFFDIIPQGADSEDEDDYEDEEDSFYDDEDEDDEA